MNDDLLVLENLSVRLKNGRPVRFLEDGAVVGPVNLRLGQGESLVLIGETGCGKSLVAGAVVGLLPPELAASGRVWHRGRDLLALSPREKQALWGREMFLFPQEPALALNPTLIARTQVSEIFRYLGRLGRSEAGRETGRHFSLVGLDPAGDGRRYPHQLSGGMRQRLVAAMTLAGTAGLVVADEPTKGLDEARREELVALLRKLLLEGKALLTITHDLKVARGLGGRLVVMYGGLVMEAGPVEEVLDRPAHPYTQALLRALPENGLRPLPEPRPNGRGPRSPVACPFEPRCPQAETGCLQGLPGPIPLGQHRSVFCRAA